MEYRSPQIVRLPCCTPMLSLAEVLLQLNLQGGIIRYWMSQVPKSHRDMLHARETQIVAFELLTAIAGMLISSKEVQLDMRRVHFIDASAALNIIVKASSRKEDLDTFVGYMWYQQCRFQATHWAKHVHRAANLAGGPSRGHFERMASLSAIRVYRAFPRLHAAIDLFSAAIEDWRLAAQANSVT